MPYNTRERKNLRTPKGGNPMGEDKNRHFRVSFTDKLKVYFKGSEVTSDGGLIAVRPACLPVR